MFRGAQIAVGGGDTATPLNLQKRLRLVHAATEPLDGKRLLDCGCGAGDYVRAFAAMGADAAVGVEYQATKLWDGLEAAGPAAVAAADLEHMPFADRVFDVAIANEVLEHVPDEAAGLSEVKRVLKPGGLFIVFSPNRLYPFETHGVFLRSSGRRLPHYVPAVPYVPLRLGRLWFRYWARNYWPWELRRLVRRAGFRLERCSFVWQTFENISGQQPLSVRRLRSSLRATANVLERLPMVRCLGVSQMIVARRPAS
jgi:ubiquinone/menaquinone biosynthesis C-methylase UbiE